MLPNTELISIVSCLQIVCMVFVEHCVGDLSYNCQLGHVGKPPVMYFQTF